MLASCYSLHFNLKAYNLSESYLEKKRSNLLKTVKLRANGLIFFFFVLVLFMDQGIIYKQFKFQK